MMKFFDICAHPVHIQGCLIEAPLHGVFIGEICIIERSLFDKEVIAKAQVIGFKKNSTILSLIGRAHGLTREMIIRPTRAAFTFSMNEQLVGKILTASGKQVGALCSTILKQNYSSNRVMRIDNPPADISERKGIDEPLVTGIRAIDGLLTCGFGQRIGIFAAAGSGKTSLMNMIINHAIADIYVIALIGERGREVVEFIEELQVSPHVGKTILVYATSDSPPIERCNAALLATTIAEFFRDLGKNVLLFVDSMTRYARALRDVALTAGGASCKERLPSISI
ncbi:ATP synthase SpaL [Providencia sneebia DSM 19967]|uniref:protein-secreting ATPase n=1 Tax=Providencia sneebia DSM 19967 TaxID=1141660 RepID=K8WTZ8_9GAMM|nr:ATP synthase SpaL [Providencia sneebia DSM 19967]